MMDVMLELAQQHCIRKATCYSPQLVIQIIAKTERSFAFKEYFH